MSWQVLEQGGVPNPAAAVFTAAEETWIKSLRVYSTADGEVGQVLVRKAGGTAEPIYSFELDTGEAAEACPEGGGLALGAGDEIWIGSTTDDLVRFTITGGERVP